MANTTYFGWETPDDTDLVKDGAAAIRTLGQAIDTSMQDLEGGTTGQILAKNSNTDMDFIWVTNDVGDITEVVAGTGLSGGGSSGSVTLTNTVATEFDAKGDLVVGTGADTFDKLTAGTDNHRLVAASGETTGLKYVADTVNTVIDAEGDLLVGDSADTIQRLAIGSNAQVLTVDTAVDGKLKWATPAGGSSTFCGVRVYNTTNNQSLANATETDLTWDSEIYDTDGFHSTSTNTSRLTVPAGKAGYYQINAFGVFNNNSTTGSRYIDIKKNGAASNYFNFANSNVDTGMTVSFVLNLAEGDYIEMAMYQASTGSLTVYKTINYGIFSMHLMGV
jgi:hypothetical protein